MKKVLVMSVAALAVATANAAPEANSFYIGVKAGGTHVIGGSFKDAVAKAQSIDVNQAGIAALESTIAGMPQNLPSRQKAIDELAKLKKEVADNPSKKDLSLLPQKTGAFFRELYKNATFGARAGLYGGYQFTKNVALEANADYLNPTLSTLGEDDTTKRHQNVTHHAVALGLNLKGNVNLYKGLDGFAKAGVNYVINYDNNVNYKDSKDAKLAFHHGAAPTVGAGLEYNFTDKLVGRLEYEYMYHITANQPYNPNIHSLTAGVSYSFGNTAKAKKVEAPVEPKEIITEKVTLTGANGKVLFAFDSADLTSYAQDQLVAISNKIKDAHLADVSVKVFGHTDRLGTEAYNLKLSQKRANSVAAFLGKTVNVVEAKGLGESQPVTSGCKGSLKQLKECLAADRRVDVEYSGKKIEKVRTFVK